MSLGAVQRLLLFRLQGLGNTDPAEDASMLVPKVLTWFPSFLWCSVLDCGGQRGKGLHLKGGF